MKQPILNILDYYKNKAFSLSAGLAPLSQNPNVTAENLMYVNNINEIQDQKLREYNAWYEGDSDRLLNLYTTNMTYEYQTEPLHDRNKRNYFWSVSATEDNIKRTHSGQPRNIVDTLVAIVGLPKISCPDTDLDKILKDNEFENIFQQEQMPRTLVEGWGAYKIDWDSSLSDSPILLYYRANEVDFYYKSNKLVGILYKNYYRDEKDRNYILFEMRRQEREHTEKGWVSNLIIEKDLFELGDNNTLKKMDLKDLKQLRDVEPRIKISNYSGFLGGACVFYKADDTSTGYGRSIYTGKIDLFDDLDQDLSQMANTVRRSTTHVYINNQYLERDSRTGMPIVPSSFDCNYIMLSGAMGADGGTAGGSEPVMTVQPRLDFSQYSSNAIDILIQCIAGVISPATLGIDIAKKDNAEAQREKEKVTIFTRNVIIRQEEKVLRNICNELLCAKQLMDKHGIERHEYDISVVFDEFADDSFEAKTETLLTLYNAQVLPPELFVDLLYSGRSKSDRDEIKKYLKDQKELLNGGSMGGMNPYDAAVMAGSMAPQPGEKVDVGDVEEDMGVAEVVGTASNMRG